MALLPAAAFSQILFQEDFDGIPGPTAGGAGTYVFPGGWFLRNVDNRTPDAQVAYVNEAWERREDFGVSVIDSVAFSTSYYSPVGQADDWMWTPIIGPITSATVLRWNARTYDPLYRDGYEVRIMTQASGPPTGGTGVLGNQVTNSTVVFSTTAENTTWTAREVPLNAYAGQSIYVGFRNNSTDKFLLVIDDVVVQHVVNHDLAVSNVSHGPYTTSPAEHQTTATNFELKGRLDNMGQQPMTNVRLACDVSVNGNLLTTVQSTPVTVPAGGNTTLTISYTPTVLGTYSFKFYPMANEIDESAANDTILDATQFVIDPLTMRRDAGAPVQSIGIGGNQGGYVGQVFNFETAVDVEAIEVYLTQGYATRQLRGAIFATDGSGVPTTMIASTDTLIYPDDSARLYRMPISGGTLNLPAGRYYFAQVEIDSTIQIGMTSSIYTAGTVYVKFPMASPTFNTIESFNIPQFLKPLTLYPVFDMCFGETGGTLDASTQASCGLSDGTAIVAMDPGYAILWEDSTTQATNTALSAGWHTFTISSTYCTFTDSVLITNPMAPIAVVDSIENALCFGGNGTITLDIQSVTPYDVIWSDGSMNETFTGMAGIYSVTITDTNNCSTTVSGAEIGQPDDLSVTVIIDNVLCSGGDGTITLDTIQGGTAPYTATWPDSSTGETFTAPAGTYDLTVLDANDCQTVESYTITEPAELDATASSTDETCNNCDDGTASVTPTGGTPPYAISWDNGDSGSPITDLEPGVYTATITDANGCDTTMTVEVLAFDDASVDDLEDFGLSVFPNPTTDQLFIRNTSGKAIDVEMTDQTGRVVASLTLSGTVNPVDLSGLATGIYTLRFVTAKGIASCKIVRQ